MVVSAVAAMMTRAITLLRCYFVEGVWPSRRIGHTCKLIVSGAAVACNRAPPRRLLGA